MSSPGHRSFDDVVLVRFAQSFELFRAHCKERVAEDFATANLHGYLFVFDVGDTRLKAGKRKCNAHTQLEHDSRCMRPSCSSHVHVHDAGKEGYSAP